MHLDSNFFPTERGNVTVNITKREYPEDEKCEAFQTYILTIGVGADLHTVHVFTNPGDTLTLNGVEWTP